MSKTTVATITLVFDDQGGADFKFEVAKIEQPTTQHARVVALANIMSHLISGIAESPALAEVNNLLTYIEQGGVLSRGDEEDG